jgi:hypothetical protein
MKKLMTLLLTLVCFTFSEGSLHAEDIGGGTFVLRGYETLKDGTIKLDSLIVTVDPNRKETNIQVTQFDPKGKGKNKWMSISELSKKPVGATKFKLSDNTILTQKNLYFGVSQDNQLILVVQTGDNSIKVVKDFKGHYDVKDLQSGQPVTLVKCKKTEDGRIKLP